MKTKIFICFLLTLLICSCHNNSKLWRIQDNGLYGFVDSLGNEIIKPQYKYVGNFRAGYACVITDAKLEIKDLGLRKDTLLKVKYGYIDAYNNLVIDTTNVAILTVEPYMYDFPKRFANKQIGFREIALPELDLVDDRFLFQDGKSMKFGYKNSEGDVVISPIYQSAKSFSNGRAVVQDTVKLEAFKDGKQDLLFLNKFGAIDVDGNKVVKCEYAYISQFSKNKDTWACFVTSDDNYETINKQWVLIDENGKVIIPPSAMWDHVYNSDEGLYVGQMNMLGIIRYTFIDRSGNFLTDYDHDGTLMMSFEEGGKCEMLSDVTAFHGGFAGIKGRYGANSVWYFANKQLDSNFTPYDSVQCFSDGLAAVKQYVDESTGNGIHSGNWGYIDKKANVVIPYQFSDCGSFIGALAYFKKWGSVYDIEGYINKQGDIVWQTICRKSDESNTNDVDYGSFSDNSQSSLLFGMMIGVLIIGCVCGVIYTSRSKNKKKLRTQIKEKIAITNDLILKKKVVSATKLWNEIKRLENSQVPEFHTQIAHMESNLESLKNDVAQKVNSKIDAIKKEFVEGSIQISHIRASEILDDKEIPQDQKDKIHLELITLEEEYKRGIIPEQQKARVHYSIEQCQRTDFYAFYNAPFPGTEIMPYRRRKIELRGYTEANFEIRLRDSLKSSSRYKVLGDVSIQTSEGGHPYEPDIAIVEISGNQGVRIDIEIDEPYGGYDKTPIHYLGCGDDFRDCCLTNLGWLVVRFSEKQIVQEPDNCIYYLQLLLSLIDPVFKITCQGSKPTPDKRWTEVKAKIMAIKQFRENLLNHNFGRKEKEGKVIMTRLTELEKDMVNNAKPICIPTDTPRNIDKTDIQFTQDHLLSFEPSEHIYMYDGRIQLIAVSNVIDDFFKPFDSIGLSERAALRNGISQCEVLEDWDCKGAESREVGTFLHSQIEAYFSNRPLTFKTSFNYKGEFVKVSKDVSIEVELSYFKNFLRDNPITPFRTEWHIFDMDLKIAGTIDLLCRNGNHYDIYDWKRSRKASPNETVWRNGINGLEHVPDISFYHYALQQNLYKYILEKNYGITVENMYIVVLHPVFGNYQKYKIPNMPKEISIIKSHMFKNK